MTETRANRTGRFSPDRERKKPERKTPGRLQTLAFIATVVVLWGGLHLYLYSRAVTALEFGDGARLALRIALPLLASLYLVARFVERVAPRPLVLLLEGPGAVWLGVFSLAFTCVALVDLLVTLPLWGAEALGAVASATALEVSQTALRLGFVAVLPLSLWGVVSALRGPRTIRFDATLAGLPGALDGFRLVQVSDVHVGGLVSQRYLRRLLATIRGLAPDLLVLVGDLSDEPDGGDGAAFRAIAAVGGTHGALAVTGNHEVYAGGDRVVRAIEAAGVPVLRQAHRVVADGLVVAGVDDPTFLGGRSHLPEAIDAALAGRPDGLPVVLLSHQPQAVRHAAGRGVALMLCGHTHGGQIPPFQLFTRLAFPYLTGRHRVGDMLLHVSNGAGFWGPPLRVGARADVTCVTLRSAPSA